MFELLVYVVLGLIAAALWQVVKVTELATALRGADPNKVTEKDNRMNARLMMTFYIVLMVTFVWQCAAWVKYFLPEAASEHGRKIDALMDFNMYVVIIPVFIIVNGFLFYAAWKYYGRDNARAAYIAHNNKLEMAWTVGPAIFLAVIIFWGLKVWNEVNTPAPKGSKVIELYSKQFDWTARYAGEDEKLGVGNYRLISGSNALGIDSTDQNAQDDIIVKGEMHLLKNQEYDFHMRSQDVIHSAYMPYFRQQINCVPGMITSYHLKPIISTDSMRIKLKDPNFDYYLICNKVCGANHFNMKMIIKVDEPPTADQIKKGKGSWLEWLHAQKRYDGKAAYKTPEEIRKDDSAAHAPKDTMKPGDTMHRDTLKKTGK